VRHVAGRPDRRTVALVGGVVVVVAAVIVVLVLRSGGSDDAGRPTPSTTTTTTTVAPVLAPLTGAPGDPAALDRCVVTVKIDNTQAARPQSGLDVADVVYEEVVEGGITRLAAMFNGRAPDRVGPVRSVRKTDQSLVRPVGGVFAYSGGAPYAVASIATAPVVRLDETAAGDLMLRDGARQAPHNLYARVDAMYGRCGPKVPPPPLFAYRPRGVTPTRGVPVTSAVVGFRSGFAVTWTWDPGRRAFARSIFGAPDSVESGTPITPRNVVVMWARYTGGTASGFGAEAELTGTGRLLVLTGGRRIEGSWTRPDPDRPARLLDANGSEILLSRGQTWVELPEDSYPVTTQP